MSPSAKLKLTQNVVRNDNADKLVKQGVEQTPHLGPPLPLHQPSNTILDIYPPTFTQHDGSSQPQKLHR